MVLYQKRRKVIGLKHVRTQHLACNYRGFLRETAFWHQRSKSVTPECHSGNEEPAEAPQGARDQSPSLLGQFCFAAGRELELKLELKLELVRD